VALPCYCLLFNTKAFLVHNATSHLAI